MMRKIECPPDHKLFEEKKKFKKEDMIWDLPKEETQKRSPSGSPSKLSVVKKQTTPRTARIDKLLLNKLSQVCQPTGFSPSSPMSKTCLSKTLQDNLIRIRKKNEFLLRSRSNSNQKSTFESARVQATESPVATTPCKPRLFLSPRFSRQKDELLQSPKYINSQMLNLSLRVESLFMTSTSTFK